jgi:tetratricopeptide (TPR) repeat protein
VQSLMDQSVAPIQRMITEGREAEAVGALRNLIQQGPALGDGWIKVLAIAQSLGDEDAVQWGARQAFVELDGRPDAAVSLSESLARIGDTAEALMVAKQATVRFPDHAGLSCHYGTKLSQAGKFEAAEAELRRCLSLQPDFAEAGVQLGAFLNFAEHPDDVATMEQLADAASGPKNAAIFFALGKAYDDLGQAERAMKSWKEGNRLVSLTMKFEPRMLEFMAYLKQRFSEPLPITPQMNSAGPKPIFIMGAPRTGTTLLEQVISAHPMVEGLGESLISRVATWPVRHMSPTSMADFEAISPPPWQQIGQIYKALVSARVSSAQFVTDKAATLHLFAGVLARAMPDAKFIWVKRRNEAAALSAFKAYFARGQAWSAKLSDAFAFLRAHDSLCEHWQSVLGPRLMKVEYETLVSEPEGQVQNILNFAGLPYDPACLNFFDNPRAVQTASLGQVRQGWTTASVDGWRRYAGDLSAAAAES